MGANESSEDLHNERRLVWPPQLISQTPLGYLQDESGNYLPRDGGVSSVLSDGTVLFQFGDTFCHSLKRKFIGLSFNTCSISHIQNACPTVSSYFSIRDDHGVSRSSEKPVPSFLQALPGEGDTETRVFKIWYFSGIVETHVAHGNHYGLCWYEAREIDKKTNDETAYLYTGIGEVVWNPEKRILKATRNSPLNRFLPSEPRFGSFCAVSDRSFIYLYGHTHAEKKDVVLARVPIHRALHKEAHQYWNGTHWSQHMNDCKPIFTTMQHGQIFKTDMFGKHSAWKWAFFGSNSWGDSKAMFGRAKAPQGPWDVDEVRGLRTYAMQPYDPAPFLYCFYPHPWAFDAKEKGDLMVSWSEGGMGGHVIAERLRFMTTADEPEEEEKQKS